MNRMKMYDIIYALAASEGREAALFGNCGPAAREAFARSLTGGAFPELWFEVPLAGEPWMDLHSLVSHEDVAGAQAAYAGHGGAYADALSWFAGQAPGKVRQLALSYDTHAGDVDRPAVQALLDGRDISVPLSFLEAAGRPDLRAGYRTFVEAMPAEWYACYVGVFPQRGNGIDTPWVRVECIVGDRCQGAYARDAGEIRSHLAQVGLAGIGDGTVSDIQELARSPFPLELQFNAGTGGAALPAVSASVRFQSGDWTEPGRRDEIGRLARWMRGRGLADDRCNLLPQTVFAKRATLGGESASLSCFPAFVKLRWSEGAPPDAKAYLLARVQQSDPEGGNRG